QPQSGAGDRRRKVVARGNGRTPKSARPKQVVTPDHLIPLGRLVNVHATRGELRLLPYNPETSTLHAGSIVVLRRNNGQVQEHRVTALRPHKRFLLLTLAGCTTMNAAESLVGSEVCVTEADLPALAAGEFYHYQLVGMTVVDLNGNRLGEVHEILTLAGNDLCVVRDGSKEILVPMVAGIVREIDHAQRRIVVDPPEGLVDL
ncbi:MAG TPA: ribosome maturation factor RimM, partial [Candidatus Acidoferrales bacterium]|nr:ribosome maturation factor RimM [Candidatus Acidoferrales bacterium]